LVQELPAAWPLPDAGFCILRLEQEGRQKAEDYSTAPANQEFRAASHFGFDQNVYGLPEDYPVNDSGSDITPLTFSAVSGSIVHWTVHAPRFHHSTRQSWTGHVSANRSGVRPLPDP
jgi:hypothetical protein